MLLSSGTAAGGTTGISDATLLTPTANVYAGWYAVPTSAGTSGSGTNAGQVRRVTANTSGGVLSLNQALSAATSGGQEYELWAPDSSPIRIHDFINRALLEVTRRGAPAMTDFSIHVGRKIFTYALPSTMIGVQKVEYRREYTSVALHNCDVVWDESVDADVTAVLDDEDYREGSGALKLTVAGTASAGDDLATDSITSTDISRCTHVEGWIKCSVAATAGQLSILLDNSAACASPLETIAMPALTAGKWTYFRVALATPWLDTAIISVGLDYTADIGACVIWLDDLKATVENSEVWEPIDPSYYYIDQDQRSLVFDQEAYDEMSYALIKLQGVKLPTLLTAETSIAEVDGEYIVNKALAMFYNSRANRKGDGYEASMALADKYERLAEMKRSRWSMPQGVKWVDA